MLVVVSYCLLFVVIAGCYRLLLFVTICVECCRLLSVAGVLMSVVVVGCHFQLFILVVVLGWLLLVGSCVSLVAYHWIIDVSWLFLVGWLLLVIVGWLLLADYCRLDVVGQLVDGWLLLVGCSWLVAGWLVVGRMFVVG